MCIIGMGRKEVLYQSITPCEGLVVKAMVKTEPVSDQFALLGTPRRTNDGATEHMLGNHANHGADSSSKGVKTREKILLE